MPRSLRLVALCLSLFCLLCVSALAQQTPTSDSFTNTAAATTNYGTSGTLNVASPSETTYIQFDLSSIPSGYTSANIAKASLKLYVGAVTKAGSFNVDFVNGTWSEKTITASLSPALGTTIAASVPVAKTATGDYIIIDVTSAVDAWLNGTQANDGIALVANSPLNCSFTSKENTGASHPPELDIVFLGNGAQGPAGPQGPKGPQGLQGTQGPAGPIGAGGPQGPAGPAGINNRGSWVSLTQYTFNDSVSYNGASWIALVPNLDSAPNPTNTNWQLMAARGINNQGSWVGSVNFQVNDAVTDGGQYWLALAPNTSSQPAITNPNWQLIAASGAPGAAGATGPQGPAGPAGPTGATGAQGLTGATGSQGVMGLTGPQGPQGATGPQGPQGPAGTASDTNSRMLFPTFFPGNLSGSWLGSKFVLDQAITVLRIAATAKTPTGATCPAAVFRFTDGTNGQDLVLTPGQFWSDSGPIVLTFAAGATLQASLRTGSTCASSTGADANLLVEYRMQASGDTNACPGTLCGGICTTPSSDPSNCGSCNTACASGVPCVGGNCSTGSCTPTTCSAKGANCGTISDGCGGILNCGACTSPQTCGGGGPNVCGSSSCMPTNCSTQGKNCGTISDGCSATLNCGTCSSPLTCGGGGVANVCGSLSCTPTTCTAQGVNCGTISDGCGGNLNCGSCSGGSVCQNNICSGCPSGDVTCGNACVNVQNDPNNCGACGNACPSSESCVAGACTCPSGDLLCSNTCVNASTDPHNCGTCGKVCGTGQSCTSGVCACPAGDSVCASACVNELTDPNNCGLCGNACTTGQVCTAGACVTAPVGDVVTWHYDNNRSGTNPNETVLTPGSVTATQFGKLGEFTVDGQIDGQVLYLNQVGIPGVGTRNVVYVATENDTVYALDAATIRGTTATVLWHTSVLGAGESAATGLPCGNISPNGITGTPVIDRARNAIYVVAKSQNGGNYYERIHALSLTTGQELFGGPTTITATAPKNGGTVTFDPSVQHARAALLESGNTIYAVWSGLYGDCGAYHGWVIGFNADSLTQTSVLNLDPNDTGGGMWMGGAGPAADASGSVYVISGNELGAGTDVPPTSYANSFIRLQPAGGLAVADYFTPGSTVNENNSGLDFGSAGPMLLPNLVDNSSKTHQLAVAAGKDGTVNLLDRTNLGGYTSGVNNVYQRFTNLSFTQNFSTPVYYNNTVYLSPQSYSLEAYSIANAQLVTPAATQTSHSFSGIGSVPTVSANGNTNGIVWALDRSAQILYAFDAGNVATELYDSSQAGGGRDSFASVGGSFITPMVANGNVYFGTSTSVVAFGLLPCGSGLTTCSNMCVNELTDPNNCGSCGKVCGAGASCTAGLCSCPSGDVLCGGINACVSTASDPNNCGACGHVCATGQACSSGQCGSCPQGDVVCSNACVSEATDPSNCGMCGHVCSTGQMCTAGACTTTGAAVCGNGIREAGEQCDDGNTLNLDGCSSTCQFEQDHRLNSLAMLGTVDSFCTANALGTKAITSIALGQLNPPISTEIAAGTLNQFLIFSGLTDLTGKTTQTGLQVGVIDGFVAPGFTYTGDVVDWWYVFDPASVGPSNVPVAQLPASIAGSTLTAGPGSITLVNLFASGSGALQLANATLNVPIGASSTPTESSSGTPPGHLAAEHVDPSLQSFTSMGSSSGGGKLCGVLTATSLAQVPIPSTLVSGTAACLNVAGSHVYTSGNSMLDVLVGGCKAVLGLVTAVNPTQPDTALSGGSICALTTDPSTFKVNVSPSCLAQDGYSSYFQFTTDRVIVK